MDFGGAGVVDHRRVDLLSCDAGSHALNPRFGAPTKAVRCEPMQFRPSQGLATYGESSFGRGVARPLTKRKQSDDHAEIRQG